MTLYQKQPPGSDPLFVAMSAEAEAAARADSASLFVNDSGFEILLGTVEADALRAEAAAEAAAQANAVPAKVTRLQGRLALLQAGLLDQAEAAVAAADRATQIWYADAKDWERSNAILNNLATTLGLSSAQVDALFRTAQTIA